METDRVRELGMHVAPFIVLQTPVKRLEKKPEPEKVLPVWATEPAPGEKRTEQDYRDARTKARSQYRKMMTEEDVCSKLGQYINKLY